MLGLSGLQLFVLGMLGEYLWRVADEVRRRPLFLVQELTGDFSRLTKVRDRRLIQPDLLGAHEG